jgi:8-oxo-dGTP diphosphatase
VAPPPEFGSRLPGITYEERPGAYGLLSDAHNNLAVVETPMGIFLPGGGLERNEEPLAGLARELEEEIGYRLDGADFLGQAVQYHWSGFYRRHFKKIGSFYRIDAAPPPSPRGQADHRLLWLPPAAAAEKLSQEFQRWAVARFSATASGSKTRSK